MPKTESVDLLNDDCKEDIEQKLLETLDGCQRAMGKAVYDMVKFYSAVGNPQKASAYYELLIPPTDNLEERALQYLEKGRLMEQQGRYQQAISFYARALPLEPQDRRIWYFINNNLGYSLNQCEEYVRAEEYCRAAIRIDPARHNAYKNLGIALEGLGRFYEAVEGYVKATELMPRDPRALAHLEDLLDRQPSLLLENSDLSQVVKACQEAVVEQQHSR